MRRSLMVTQQSSPARHSSWTARLEMSEMASTQAIKQAVRAGVGISLISSRAVQDECRAGLLCCVTISDLRISRSFHLVTHRDRSRSPLAQAFLAFLEESSSTATA